MMTGKILDRGGNNRKTLAILLLSANLLLLLVLFIQVTKQYQATEQASLVMGQAIAEQTTKVALDRLSHEYEVLLRERLQARLERDEARGEVEKLLAATVRRKGRLEAISGELDRTRAERDEHQGARIALERRVSDALTMLASPDELRSRVEELDAALARAGTARADEARALAEVDRLRRKVLVLERLVTALKARL